MFLFVSLHTNMYPCHVRFSHGWFVMKSWHTHKKKGCQEENKTKRPAYKRARVGCNSDCTFEICFVLSVFFSQNTRTHTYTHTRSHGQIKPNGSHFVCYMKPVNHWMLSHLNKLSFFASC